MRGGLPHFEAGAFGRERALGCRISFAYEEGTDEDPSATLYGPLGEVTTRTRMRSLWVQCR